MNKEADNLDRANKKAKEKFRYYKFIEEATSRPVRETWRWVERHPTEAAVLVLLVATAGAACADGCTVIIAVTAETAGGGTAAIGVPVAVYAGDRRDLAAQSRSSNTRKQGNSAEAIMPTTPPAPQRTKEEVESKLSLLQLPEMGKPVTKPQLTIVPGLTTYRYLQPHERAELDANLARAAGMPFNEWMAKSLDPKAWDYKNREGWGPAYAAFGNINYGATGKEVFRMLASADTILFFGGGLAQQYLPQSAKLYDKKNGSWTDLFRPSKGRERLMGDAPEDHAAIRAGISIRDNYELIKALQSEWKMLEWAQAPVEAPLDAPARVLP